MAYAVTHKTKSRIHDELPKIFLDSFEEVVYSTPDPETVCKTIICLRVSEQFLREFDPQKPLKFEAKKIHCLLIQNNYLQLFNNSQKSAIYKIQAKWEFHETVLIHLQN